MAYQIQPAPTRQPGKMGDLMSRLGFGAFKIGRNTGIKYPDNYDLPDDASCERLLNSVLDLGVSVIDTAPAYGISEQRIGQFIATRRDEYLLSSKVGELFEDGHSRYDYSRCGVLRSIENSLARLRTDRLDFLFIHSNGDDSRILNETDVVSTLLELRTEGVARRIGLSGKTVEGALASLDWADVLMVEYNSRDTSHDKVMTEAASRGLKVLVKKGLGSGHLPASESIRFVLDHEAVSTLIIGGLSLPNLKANLESARSAPQRDVAY